MTCHSTEIKQGDSLVWLARPNTLDAGVAIGGNWVCRVGLYTDAGVEAVAPVTITEKYTYDSDEYFVAALARTDTSGLTPGKYIFAIDIRNDAVTPNYSDESFVNVTVKNQLIPV